jgi:hypothetical protein
VFGLRFPEILDSRSPVVQMGCSCRCLLRSWEYAEGRSTTHLTRCGKPTTQGGLCSECARESEAPWSDVLKGEGNAR